jgi:hypothetical protein
VFTFHTSSNMKHDLRIAILVRLLANREELVLHRGTRNRRAAMGGDQDLWLQLALVRFAEKLQKQSRRNVQTLALSQAVITIAVAR